MFIKVVNRKQFAYHGQSEPGPLDDDSGNDSELFYYLLKARTASNNKSKMSFWSISIEILGLRLIVCVQKQNM